MGNEAIEDVLSQAAAILGNQDAGYDGPGLGKSHCPKLNMIEEKRASDNESKFYSFLMCRIWIYSQK